MNKKYLIVGIIFLVLIIGMEGYFMLLKNNENNLKENNNIHDNKDNNVENESKDETNSNRNKKVAIVYFSVTGTTKTVAEYIQDETNGDIIEIVPKDKYTNNDLDYNDNNSRANKEQNNPNARPEIDNEIDISFYDTIYLGYPIWWTDVPKIILTFLDTYDLSGKRVYPFCTSHSSGISSSLSTLKNYNKDINWKDGKRFTSSSRNEIKNWIKEVNNE